LPAAAGAGFVLTRHRGFDEALVLMGMMVVYDSAAYLIGTGAKRRWEGPIAGIASVGILSVLVAAVVSPPFTGSSPWILGGMAAVLLPLGPVVCRRLIGQARSQARVPALRRLDSVVLLAPAWPAVIALLLPKH
jgi:CDP-diglyceride synthetase